MFKKLGERNGLFDFIIIGGGASGAGMVMEAATRGYSAVLFEKSDFAKSTSGKSTKLVHGGVRYLAQGNISLVREACVERGLLMRNAPHLVRNQSFIIPAYGLYDELLYTAGLKIYDLMAGTYSLGRSERISADEVVERMPTVSSRGLTAGVLYHDGQFDDARLVVNVLQTAVEHGAIVLNYAEVNGLLKDGGGRLTGVIIHDPVSGVEHKVKGRAVLNATGVFADEIMQMDEPGKDAIMRPSQGIHIVVDRSFLPGNDALMIPKTVDGRVLFAIPWHGRIVIGTTDTPIEHATLEPVALEEEIEFILQTAGKYLARAPGREDVLSVFAGLRPLAASKNYRKTKEISRSHRIIMSRSGLFTMIGGKWTTFRKMGEDMISRVEKFKGWKRTKPVTRSLRIHGYEEDSIYEDQMYVYGSDRDAVLKLADDDPSLEGWLSSSLGIARAQVAWAVREEMAVSLEDVLSRRTRAQLLDARESLRIAPEAARIMAGEQGRDVQWIESQVSDYRKVTEKYLLNGV